MLRLVVCAVDEDEVCFCHCDVDGISWVVKEVSLR